MSSDILGGVGNLGVGKRFSSELEPPSGLAGSSGLWNSSTSGVAGRGSAEVISRLRRLEGPGIEKLSGIEEVLDWKLVVSLISTISGDA